MKVRKGQGNPKLSREEFGKRFRARFYDPAFDSLNTEIERLENTAWDGYINGRKSPRTRKAGAEFADPSYDLSVEWLEARDAIRSAERAQRDPAGRRKVLLICGSSRTDTTCPGEMSKTFRLTQLARGRSNRRMSRSTSWISVISPPNTVVGYFPARPACPRRCRYVTGSAPVTRITASGR